MRTTPIHIAMRSVRSIGAAAALMASATLLPGGAEATTLTFATNTAPNNLRGIAETIFIEELAAQSNGEIEVVPYWGSSLMDGREILGGVRDGVADMGFVNINYYPNRLLLNSSFMLFPRGPVSYEDRMTVFRSAYSDIPDLADELSEEGVKVVYLYGVMPFAGTFTKDVSSLEGFDGLRIRASSRWYLNLLDAVGATPVSVPWSECYQALQTGAIDSVFTNLDGIHRASLDEVAPNVFIMNQLWLPTPFLITINEAKWEGLSDAEKDAFAKAWDSAEKKFAEKYGAMFDEVVKAQKDAGYKVTFATDEEADAFANLPQVAANRETWISEAKDAGATDPEATLEKLKGLISASLGN
ncbi:TRAP transporter substrate-binding protein [Acuticoccus sediminis]|nr:TRAP transporter substrate-binding protein DctP [Acuticoccus sediminis]